MKVFSESQAKPRVLLIAPTPETRSRFQEVLGSAPIEFTVSDGSELIPPDMALPDVILIANEQDDFDVIKYLQRVRSHLPTENVPVILLTSRPKESLSLTALKEGADDIAAEPFTADRLLARVEAHVTLARLRAEEEEHAPRAFEQLRLNERRYRSLVSATSAVVWIAEEDGRITTVLESWEAFTGQSLEEYQDFGWISAVHPDDRDELGERWRKASSEEESQVNVEFRLLRKDGEYRRIHLNSIAVRNKKIDVFEWFGAATDVTQQRQTEADLREREERLRLIFESSTDFAIFTIDLEGKVTTWNTGAQRLLGYSTDEICGTDFHRIFIEEDIEAGVPEEEMDDALRTGRGADQRWHRRKDGSLFWADGLVMPLRDDRNQVRGFLKIVRDFTAQKKAQDDLRALTEELEVRVAKRTWELEESRTRLRSLVFELNKTEQMERQRIAAELHDTLAQLLTAAGLSLESITRSIEQPPINRSLKKVQEIISEATRATRSLMTDLSGPRVLEHDDLIVTLQWVADKMRESGLTVTLTHNRPKIPMERDLLTLLFQSVRELLLNVQKYSGVSEATVHVERHPDHLLIEVVDKGQGFDPRKTLEIPPREGGFGLMNVKERLRWLDGTLDIDSAPGHGARATISLPSLETDEPAVGAPAMAAPVKPSQDHPVPQGNPISVLLVDDHRMVREGFRSVIGSKADIHIVGEAADGIEALEKARELEPDVVVMDINMPRMNGLDATRRLRDEMPEVKVIGLSIHEPEDLSESVKNVGGVAYLSKDAAFDKLCEVIRAQFPREKAS